MFRTIERPVSYKHRARQWINKMLFLWTHEQAPSHKGNDWFTWLTTAAFFWTCRRPILRAIRAVSPLRFIRSHVPSRLRSIKRTKALVLSPAQVHRQSLILHPKLSVTTGIRTKVKRLGTGDGPHLTACTNVNQINQKIYYRVTRSGRVYGTYPNKVASC
ncbi:uncharacterized protein LOC130670270 [Microplitis mediator]|uniref:uncharacterized protein LOC130670270 n=1 Tax=Microplitis mediator TaxID=375433 RepID=UPI002555A828|nr:uncharacterized protein LOC130670270 [Microplitis mediator]